MQREAISVYLMMMVALNLPGTDILLGYHSEEGWTAALRLLSSHYGMEAQVSFGTEMKNPCS